MTIESLLLLAFLLALPLLDRLARAIRARLIAIGEQVVPPVRPGPPPIPADERPALPVGEPPASLRRGRTRYERPNRPAVPDMVDPRPHRPSRGGGRRWTNPVGDRRRAIVLMTILGPCRALDGGTGGPR